MAFTIVYSVGVGDSYRFDEASYDQLEAAGVPWPLIMQVLRTHPKIRRHHPGGLVLAAAVADDKGGETWIVVALVEEGDDQYLVRGARPLGPDEIETIQAVIKRSGHDWTTRHDEGTGQH